MDASSTTFHMIPYLKKAKDVTVITNGIHTAMELQRNSNFKSIIILGGMLRPHSGAIEGLSSKEMIGRLSAEFSNRHPKQPLNHKVYLEIFHNLILFYNCFLL